MSDLHRYFKRLVIAGMLTCAAAPEFAQTQINLRTQSRDVDFSQAGLTRSFQTGTVLPPVCSPGDLFFNSAGPAGQNVYGCTATNTWALEGGGGGGGATLATQLGDFALSGGAGPTLTIGGNCSPITPCNYTDNNVPALSLTAPCTATISGTTGSGTAYIYVSPGGQLTIGHNSAATLTADGTCSIAVGITGFPDGSEPIAAPTFTSNLWAAVTSAFDRRGFLGANVIAAGTGIATAVNGVTGVKTVSTDPSIIPEYTTGSGAPSGSCVRGGDFYTDTLNNNLWWCSAANVWTQANGGGAGVANPVSVLVAVHRQTATSLSGVTSGSFTALTGSTVTVPGNSMGANGCLRVSFSLQQSGTTAKDYNLQFGTSSVNFVYDAAFGGSTTLGYAQAYICNGALTNSQNVEVGEFNFGGLNPPVSPVATMSVSTTTNQNLSIAAAPHGSTGGAGDSVQLVDFFVELLPHS
jgi:hypothetical protein